MTKNEKMTQCLEEWRTALEAMEHKLTELTFQIERQRGAIAAAETLMAMTDDGVGGDSGRNRFVPEPISYSATKNRGAANAPEDEVTA